jgi:hypothetical protein
VALSAGAFGLGTVAGFAAIGLLAQYLSWCWIFVAGAVLVAGGFGAVLAAVPAMDDRAGGGYNWLGTVALGVAASGLLVALTLVVPLGWDSPVTAGPARAGGAGRGGPADRGDQRGAVGLAVFPAEEQGNHRAPL